MNAVFYRAHWSANRREAVRRCELLEVEVSVCPSSLAEAPVQSASDLLRICASMSARLAAATRACRSDEQSAWCSCFHLKSRDRLKSCLELVLEGLQEQFSSRGWDTRTSRWRWCSRREWRGSRRRARCRWSQRAPADSLVFVTSAYLPEQVPLLLWRCPTFEIAASKRKNLVALLWLSFRQLTLKFAETWTADTGQIYNELWTKCFWLN